MVIKWSGAPQHTDWGNVSPGDVINTAERGIPAGVALAWVRDGFAVEVKESKQKKAAPSKDAE